MLHRSIATARMVAHAGAWTSNPSWSADPPKNETLKKLVIPWREAFYDGWAKGPWRWNGVEEVRQLVNDSVAELRLVRWDARAIAKGETEPATLKRLQRIQGALAHATPTMRGCGRRGGCSRRAPERISFRRSTTLRASSTCG